MKEKTAINKYNVPCFIIAIVIAILISSCSSNEEFILSKEKDISIKFTVRNADSIDRTFLTRVGSKKNQEDIIKRIDIFIYETGTDECMYYKKHIFDNPTSDSKYVISDFPGDFTKNYDIYALFNYTQEISGRDDFSEDIARIELKKIYVSFPPKFGNLKSGDFLPMSGQLEGHSFFNNKTANIVVKRNVYKLNIVLQNATGKNVLEREEFFKQGQFFQDRIHPFNSDSEISTSHISIPKECFTKNYSPSTEPYLNNKVIIHPIYVAAEVKNNYTFPLQMRWKLQSGSFGETAIREFIYNDVNLISMFAESDLNNKVLNLTVKVKGKNEGARSSLIMKDWSYGNTTRSEY